MSDPITPLTPEQTATREARAVREPYLERVAIALDEDVNVDTGGLPDETISSRWARWSKMNGFRGVVGRTGSRMLNLFQRDHGAQAIAGDDARAKRVAAIEENSGEISS